MKNPGRRTTLRRGLVAAAAAMCLSVATTPASSAADTTSASEQGRGNVTPTTGRFAEVDALTGGAQEEYVLSLGFDEGLYLDMLGVAATRDVPLSRVLERMYGSEEFERSAAAIRAVYPDSVTAVRWLDGYGEVWVSTAAADKARSLATSDSTRIVPTTLPNEAELERQIVGAAAALNALKLDSFELEFSIDSERYMVSVPESTSDEQLATIRKVLGNGTQIDRSFQATPQAAKGGENYAGCTGGFIGKISGGGTTAYGIITAQHCYTTPSTYDGQSVVGTAALSGIDVRFTSMSGPAANFAKTVRTGVSATQTVIGAANPTVGTVVCKYGSSSKSGCDWIEAGNVCVQYSGAPNWCGMFRAETNITQGGDSGGPWFTNGATARGIHSGVASGKSVFTGIASVTSAGVSVYY